MLPWQQSVQNLLKTHCTQTQHTHCNFRACGTWEGKHSEWRRERKWFRVHTKDCTGLHTYVHTYAMYVLAHTQVQVYTCTHAQADKRTYACTVPLRKKLACNWRSLNYGRVVARIRERAFWITQRVYTYV